jgi:hypothetical protein
MSALGRPIVDARLDKYQGLRAKVEGMLDIIENAGADVEKAAVAEQRVIDAMRELGHEVLERWAHEQQASHAAGYEATPGVNRKEKNALLVHPPREDRGCRDRVHTRAQRPRTAAVLGVGRGRLPRVLAGVAAGHDRLWGG